MKNDIERNLYIKKLYENIGKIIMDKLFDKYCGYINYNILNTFRYKNTDTPIDIYDPVYAFFFFFCRKIIKENMYDNKTVIYQIMSPYHKKEAIYGLLITNSNFIALNLISYHSCKGTSLYTLALSQSDIKYLSFADNIFRNTNKKQQE